MIQARTGAYVLELGKLLLPGTIALVNNVISYVVILRGWFTYDICVHTNIYFLACIKLIIKQLIALKRNPNPLSIHKSFLRSIL